MTKLRVKRISSDIGIKPRQKEGLRCLGLKKIGQEVVLPNNESIRGQIFKLQHLLDVKVEGKK